MEVVEVELLSNQTSSPVFRLPWRAYPGVLIQGDSLSTISTAISEADEALKRGDVAEAQEVLSSLADRLNEMLQTYELALSAHGIGIPYATKSKSGPRQ